jgi:hypothetical protein
MNRYVVEYKIISSFDLPKDLDFEEIVSGHVSSGEWELFGPPLMVSHDGNLCFAQALCISEERD